MYTKKAKNNLKIFKVPERVDEWMNKWMNE